MLRLPSALLYLLSPFSTFPFGAVSADPSYSLVSALARKCFCYHLTPLYLPSRPLCMISNIIPSIRMHQSTERTSVDHQPWYESAELLCASQPSFRHSITQRYRPTSGVNTFTSNMPTG